MFNLQGSEIIVILLLALVVLGPEKLPDAIRKFSHTYNELKKMGTGFQSEIKSALDEPMREMRETADLLKDSVDPDKLQAEVAAEAELQRQAEADAIRQAAIDEAEAVAEEERARAAVAADDTADEPADEAVDEVPRRPINQIAQANARGKIESVRATPADVDVDAIPTFATASEATSATGDDSGDDVDGADDDANEAAVS